IRHVKIMKEGVQFPTISVVVIGDKSSGKTSVLESLAGISLSTRGGQPICTRVPLIMRLQNHPNLNPELFLEFAGKTVPTDEQHVSAAISLATEEIAGKGKGLSNNPITLVVKKNGVPNLTIVDLPGITRVPVHGQPEDIHEQISKIIMEFITPEESIILNVLPASVDFCTCESIRLSKKVDRTGRRTLAVVTRADQSPQGLLDKVAADDVSIGLGYVCVRNRIGDESFDEAREEEARLFDTHPHLSKIDKSIVGIPVLAEWLVCIQAGIIIKFLPEIVRKINEKLTSFSQPCTTYKHILDHAKDSLRKILLQGEFGEYPDENAMHCTARLAEMLNMYSEALKPDAQDISNCFAKSLIDKIRVLEESISDFRAILENKMEAIYPISFIFIENVWDYVERVFVRVLSRHYENHPEFLPLVKRKAQKLIAMKKKQSIDWAKDAVEMEMKLADYTCHREHYSALYRKLMADEDEFLEAFGGNNIGGGVFRNADGVHLREMETSLKEEAFDVATRVRAYWEMVSTRMVDNMALHLRFAVRNLVTQDIEALIT
ncbi:hypothetical protein MIMGU_mgv1a023769mg, partial [Erythranthe guttata]